MKKFLCLIIVLALCIAALFVFRDKVTEFTDNLKEKLTKDDTVADAPDANDVGKKGDSETTKVEGTVDQNGPNVQLPDWTTRN